MAGSAVNFVQDNFCCLCYNSRYSAFSSSKIKLWRNIRNGFVRSLKPTPSGSSTKQKKLYYLHEELQFLLPFVRAVVVISKTKKSIKPVNNEADKAFVVWLKTKENKKDDPRKIFLLSLLPDVQSLTDEQMSVFRIKMWMLLEEIKKPTCSVIQPQINQFRVYSPISPGNAHSS
ncbi:hypothetical protein ABMA28_003128 [Loxostege sticticalis]|uniref:BESS domain-containing protein n=1 Tax=Loxostege sticticalis TaxID=481309 RepID=A0ABD0SXG7_LOXSC